MKKRRPFELKKFMITQENVSLPVTTDACIFGALSQFHEPKNILDVGCGSGLLMFMMHQKYPMAQILGLERHPESVQTVRQNIQLNDTHNQLSVIQSDWWQFEPEQSFDAIICNPPFFSNQLPSQETVKRNARHTENYLLSELLVHLSKWLNPKGRISMLIPYEKADTIQQNWLEPSQNDLNIKKYHSIRAFKDTPPYLSVVHFEQSKNPQIEEMELIIYEKQGQFTPASKELLYPFLQDRALK